jgi:hypothetical protein
MDAIHTVLVEVREAHDPVMMPQVFDRMISLGAIGQTEDAYPPTVTCLLTAMRRPGEDPAAGPRTNGVTTSCTPMRNEASLARCSPARSGQTRGRGDMLHRWAVGGCRALLRIATEWRGLPDFATTPTLPIARVVDTTM